MHATCQPVQQLVLASYGILLGQQELQHSLDLASSDGLRCPLFISFGGGLSFVPAIHPPQLIACQPTCEPVQQHQQHLSAVCHPLAHTDTTAAKY